MVEQRDEGGNLKEEAISRKIDTCRLMCTNSTEDIIIGIYKH